MYRRNSFDSDVIPAFPSRDDCLSRVPYSSVMAFVMCAIGVIVFAIMMVWSFNASVEQARRALDIVDIPWLSRVHLAFIIVAILMVIVSLFLLLIGVLSTGSTREEVYKRKESRRGGRIFCALGIVLSYALYMIWTLVLAATAILSFVYFIFSELCSSLNGYSDGNCLDFGVFRPLVSEYSASSLKLCGGNVQEFCALTNTVFSWNVVGFFGAWIICLGLVQFVASMASNYAHVNNEQRYIELKDVLYYEGGAGPGPEFVMPPQPRQKTTWTAPRPPQNGYNNQTGSLRPRKSASADPSRRRDLPRQRYPDAQLRGSNPWINQY